MMVAQRRENKKVHFVQTLLFIALALLFVSGLFTACQGQQPTQIPAGTATQDPPIPKLTEATHGILDTTGTVPQSVLAQLRTQSDEVQTQGYQVAVVFFNNLVSDPHQFATTVFNTNAIGFKDTNNGVLFVLYLQKQGKDGPAPWLAYITGGGISGALPDTLMDDYAQTTFVPARAQGQWQNGLLAFYAKVATAERDPSIARDWQTKNPKSQPQASPTGSSNSSPNPVAIIIIVAISLAAWLSLSAIIAARRRENFFFTAFRLLGGVLRVLLFLALFSRGSGGGSSSGRGGSGSWGGGGSSPSSGGDV